LDIDYSKFDEAARARVAAFIADLDIGILVNNVGMSYPFTKYFHELTDGEVANLMTLNVDSTTWMTRLVLPCMLKKHKVPSSTLDLLLVFPTILYWPNTLLPRVTLLLSPRLLIPN